MSRLTTHASVHSIIAAALLLTSAVGQDIEVRQYDVQAIVEYPSHDDFVLQPAGDVRFRSQRGEGPAFGTGADEFVAWPFVDDDQLEELVYQLVIDAGVADEHAERLHLEHGVLSVSATPAVHEQLGAMLGYLESIATRRIDVECLLVEPATLDGLAPAWRSSGLTAAEFERVLEAEDAELHSLSARSGQRVATDSGTIHALLSDHEINQTGVIPVSNPVISTLNGGTRVELRPVFEPGGSRVVIDLSIGLREVSSVTKSIGRLLSDLQLPVLSEMLFSTTVLAAPGDVVLAGSIDGDEGTGDGRVAVLRVSTRVAAAAPAPGDGVVRVHDGSALLRSAAVRAWPLPRIELAESFGWKRYDADALHERMLERFGFQFEGQRDLAFHHSRWFLAGSPAEHDRAARFLQEEFARRVSPVRLDLRLVTLPRTAFVALRKRVDPDGVLPSDWESVLPADASQLRLQLAGLAGEVNCVRQTVVRGAIVGVEEVSGGTGFAIIQMSDPVSATFGEGVDFRYRIDPGRDGRARLLLYGDDVRSLGTRDLTARVPTIGAVSAEGRTRPGGSYSSGSDVVEDVKELTLTLPRQTVTDWSVSRDVPPGRDVLLKLEAVAGSQPRILVGRVSMPRRE